MPESNDINVVHACRAPPKRRPDRPQASEQRKPALGSANPIVDRGGPGQSELVNIPSARWNTPAALAPPRPSSLFRDTVNVFHIGAHPFPNVRSNVISGKSGTPVVVATATVGPVGGLVTGNLALSKATATIGADERCSPTTGCRGASRARDPSKHARASAENTERPAAGLKYNPPDRPSQARSGGRRLHSRARCYASREARAPLPTTRK